MDNKKVSTAAVGWMAFCLFAVASFGPQADVFAQDATYKVSGRVDFYEKTLTGHRLLEKSAEVIVYLNPSDDPTKAKLADMPKQTVWLNQKDKQFIPRVTVVQRGANVRFGNEDPWFHNVYSNKPKFNLGRYPRGFFKEQSFDDLGVKHIFCDIHPSMHAFILVVDTPLFAQVNDGGAFELEAVPAGTYQLTAWNNLADPVVKEMEISNNQTELKIELKAKEMETPTRTPPGAYEGKRSLLNR